MKKRIIYFDYLRVFATFAVIILHIAASKFSSTDVNLFEWKVMNFYDSFVRWAVPVFVMISGALFLGKECDLNILFNKNILRLGIAYIFWGGFYKAMDGGSMGHILVKTLAGGCFHLWFIPMIVGLYIVLPILNQIVKSEKIMKYFLILAIVFAFLVPTIVKVSNNFLGKGLLLNTINALNESYNDMNFRLVTGYTAYFIGGYYLSRININKNIRTVIYLLGLFGVMVIFVCTDIISVRTQVANGSYYNNLHIFVMFNSIAVFVFFKYNFNKIRKIDKLIHKLSQYNFGAYLVHVLVMRILENNFGLHSLSFNPVLAIPVTGIAVFVGAFLLSAIINQIPILKKYIV